MGNSEIDLMIAEAKEIESLVNSPYASDNQIQSMSTEFYTKWGRHWSMLI